MFSLTVLKTYGCYELLIKNVFFTLLFLGEKSMSFLKQMALDPVKEAHFVFLRLPGNCCSCSELKRIMR